MADFCEDLASGWKWVSPQYDTSQTNIKLSDAVRCNLRVSETACPSYADNSVDDGRGLAWPL